jgi:LysM repeat protein
LGILAVFSLAAADNKNHCAESGGEEKSASCVLLNAQNTVDSVQNLTILEGSILKGVPSPVFVKPQSLASISDFGEEAQAEKEEKDIIQYTVKEGDTLAGIAEKFKISTETVLWANNLKKGSFIKAGQKLIILPVSGVMHIVKEKDTVSGIAKTYKAQQDQIIAFNQMEEGSKLIIGDMIIVPGGKVSSPTAASTPILAQSAGNVLPEGYFIIPTTGTISQRLHFYNAVDIANQCGTPVFASAGGKVQISANQWPLGIYTNILHPNGVVTIYAHLSKVLVSAGETVSQGQLIGYIGNTGRVIGVTGCHLHFDVRGTANPLAKYRLGALLSFKK